MLDAIIWKFICLQLFLCNLFAVIWSVTYHVTPAVLIIGKWHHTAACSERSSSACFQPSPAWPRNSSFAAAALSADRLQNFLWTMSYYALHAYYPCAAVPIWLCSDSCTFQQSTWSQILLYPRLRQAEVQNQVRRVRLSSRWTHCLEQSSWPPPSDQWH